MKLPAILIIFIFALNVFSEVGSGHCHESGVQELSSGMHASLTSNDTGSSPHAGAEDTHTCHFGHCAHLILAVGMPASNLFSDASLWRSVALSVTWRALSPLFKPPIA